MFTRQTQVLQSAFLKVLAEIREVSPNVLVSRDCTEHRGTMVAS